MKTIFVILALIILTITSVNAQEKVVQDISVKLGVMSWEEIQAASKEKPAAHTEELHRKMAKSMSEMHGGARKGAYHIMVMVMDKSTGNAVKHADVMVTAVAKAGPEEITHKLQRMSMDGFSGFGEFYKLTFKGPYVFKVDIQKSYRLYTTKFEKTIQ
jgi:hypothetical protein